MSPFLNKDCRKCSIKFEITASDQAFYVKMQVPEPTLCPACRMQRRTTFRNERNLYMRKCDATGRDIISVYPPDSPFKIYDQTVWWGDSWNAVEYGRDFDFNRPFFEQFYELALDVPRINLQNRNCENSEYCHDCSGSINSYLCFNGGNMRDSHYCTTYGMGSTDCMDMFWSLASELCYEGIKVFGAYHCFWCFNCAGISDCYFCEDLRECKNCFGCVGLRQREYCIHNQPVGKEKYEQFMKEWNWTRENIKIAKEKLTALRLQVPRKNLEIQNSENCLGDYISNSKNCTFAFDVIDSENVKYFWDGMANNGMDCFNAGINTNFVYECVAVYSSTNIKFCNKCSESSDLLYCDFCMQCEHCFGCIGLQRKKYCILNKQYSEEEYFKMRDRLIKHMEITEERGEFFPASLSPFGYNDSMAQEYFPLSREDALKSGLTWNDYKNPKPEGLKYIPARNLPESIEEVSDDIVNWALECNGCQKFFKITPWELKFYHKEGLPIPKLCPDCRHFERKGKINPRKLYDRTCMKCDAEMKTSYAADRPEIVYCEKCYLESLG
ncbi:hypothetical protein HOG48_04235 [Candidatus Peregrinibacteria bacterium]|jgi:hypothetical protein|nr:hypothetical protein [Candidatus Peregrinibacteria bacterium]